MSEQKLNREDQWAKLAHWLEECIEAVERGDLTRLPSDFAGEKGEAAVEAYKTVQQAMHILEHWETMGLPKSKPNEE